MGSQYLQCSLAGLLISLMGSMPLGTLNVAAMQLATKESLKQALYFSIGVVLIEMAYISVTIFSIGSPFIQPNVLIGFRAVSILFLLIMAVGSFISAKKKNNKHIILDSKLNRFALGASMSALNPMQIPFWLGWIAYLLGESYIVNTVISNLVFILSAGIGTFIALSLFMLAGKRFAIVMAENKGKVALTMGAVFSALAMYQAIQFFK